MCNVMCVVVVCDCRLPMHIAVYSVLYALLMFVFDDRLICFGGYAYQSDGQSPFCVFRDVDVDQQKPSLRVLSTPPKCGKDPKKKILCVYRSNHAIQYDRAQARGKTTLNVAWHIYREPKEALHGKICKVLYMRCRRPHNI